MNRFMTIVSKASGVYYADDDESISSASSDESSKLRGMQPLLELIDSCVTQSQLDHEEFQTCNSRLVALERESSRLRLHLSSLEEKANSRTNELSILRERLRDIYSRESRRGYLLPSNSFKGHSHFQGIKESHPEVVFISASTKNNHKLARNLSISNASSPGSATITAVNRKCGKSFFSPLAKKITKKDRIVDSSTFDTSTHSDITIDAESVTNGSSIRDTGLSIDAERDDENTIPATAPLQYIRVTDLNLPLEGNDLFSDGWAGLYPFKYSNSARREFVSRILGGLCDRAMRMEKSSDLDKSGALVRWKPDGGTERLCKTNSCDFNLSGVTSDMFHKYFDRSILIWQGSYSEKTYRDDLPISKTRAIILTNPRNVAELILDSNRVTVYNKLSLGRTDEMILQSGIDTEDGPYGPGETKVVRNLTKPPFIKRSIEVVSLIHCRRVSALADKTDHGPGYVIITRAVNQEPNDSLASESADRTRAEIVISCNIVRPVLLLDGTIVSDLTCVNHINSPGVPLMIAKRIGLSSAKNFIADVRNALE